ncbi:helix-turn-helix transcriptional regulator [Mycobacterium sherrisii]|uniref:helix-turn-helix domain-containing protein n=1 Tax=Mycobacterium sherrisii TaxID=243061 RepID=UPI002DDCBF4F|nr:helix-turn-helix transcriptional regulator [Mycobacterium sherrisii]MEC4764766.1 helix-turn-helix transcriptional regulator [Mycobacterium sherrisii]
MSNRFGERLQAERERRGWSQSSMAEKLGEHGFSCYPTTVAKLEANERTLAAEELGAYADAFGCSVDWLMGRRARPAADRALALQRLNESTIDAEEAVRTSVRHITQALAPVVEIDHQDGKFTELAAAVQAACAALDSAREQFPLISAMIAEHGVGSDIVKVRPADPQRVAEVRRKIAQKKTPRKA